MKKLKSGDFRHGCPLDKKKTPGGYNFYTNTNRIGLMVTLWGFLQIVLTFHYNSLILECLKKSLGKISDLNKQNNDYSIIHLSKISISWHSQ